MDDRLPGKPSRCRLHPPFLRSATSPAYLRNSPITRKGYFRKNKLILHFDKRFSKALKQCRKKGWKLTSKVAFALALRVFKRVDAQKDEHGLQWPRVRRTNLPWVPKLQWVRSWLNIRGWKPRVPTKKKTSSPEADCAMMQKWRDKLRHLLRKQPPSNEHMQMPEPHLQFGFYKVNARYNRDQVFLLDARGPVWRSEEQGASMSLPGHRLGRSASLHGTCATVAT